MLRHKYTTKLLDPQLIADKINLKQGDKVADFGCGRAGAFSFWAGKKVGAKGLVYAIDVVKDHLFLIDKEAKENNLANIKTIWADLELLGGTRLDSNSLDMVLIINTLHQSRQPVNILHEAYRILKKGANLVIIDWTRGEALFSPERRIDKKALKSAAEKIGLDLADEFLAGPNHFALVFKK